MKLETPVTVAVVECYDKRCGAFPLVFSWDGEAASVRALGPTERCPRVDGTPEQKAQAFDWLRANHKGDPVAAYMRFRSMVDAGAYAEVTGGRKAKKGTKVFVLAAMPNGKDALCITPDNELAELNRDYLWGPLAA